MYTNIQHTHTHTHPKSERAGIYGRTRRGREEKEKGKKDKKEEEEERDAGERGRGRGRPTAQAFPIVYSAALRDVGEYAASSLWCSRASSPRHHAPYFVCHGRVFALPFIILLLLHIHVF